MEGLDFVGFVVCSSVESGLLGQDITFRIERILVQTPVYASQSVETQLRY